ncbi:MAG: translation initiation factor IF-2 [archaeon]
MKLKQPIVTVVGHVDHGKTTILDSIRGTCIASKEAGLITQKISFTNVPSKVIQKRCPELLKKYNINLEIPGFLFIDTPGHAAFTNLRKRGGALADLAILIIDINEGIMEQTKESIEVLKKSKVPFIVALNKVDNVFGWNQLTNDLKDNIEKQSQHTKKDFEKKLFSIMNSLSTFGFDSDLFYRVNDFTKQIALVPCSGKKCEGVQELVVMLAGIAQKFLKGKLELGKEAKGTLLEIKKEKGFTNIEAILYDGILKKTDKLLIAGLDKPIETKIRALFNSLELGKGFKAEKEVSAASGINLHLPSETAGFLIPGTPFVVLKNREEQEKELQQEIKQILQTDQEGIIVKAESLGSLEALMFLLRKSGFQIKKASIGEITHQDITLARSNLEKHPLNSVIVGFNVSSDIENSGIKIITSEIIYHIIEELQKWIEEKEIEIKRQSLAKLSNPAKIKILRNHCFRKSKPAIFGVKVEAGTLKTGSKLINEDGEEIDKLKNIQSENKTAEKVEIGAEVAISLAGVTFGRQIKEDQILFTDIPESEFLKLKQNKKYLRPDEIVVLQEIAQIKRKTNSVWGV